VCEKNRHSSLKELRIVFIDKTNQQGLPAKKKIAALSVIFLIQKK
jgi:hypothetical protein